MPIKYQQFLLLICGLFSSAPNYAAVTIAYTDDTGNRLTHPYRPDNQKQNIIYDFGNIIALNGTDSEGLGNTETVYYGTQMFLDYTDVDGANDRNAIVALEESPTHLVYYKDGFEVQDRQYRGENSYVHGRSANANSDKDSLTNVHEQAAGSSPANLDENNDGFRFEASVSRSGTDNRAMLVFMLHTLLLSCDDTDFDNDGLSDCFEETIGIDPFYFDSDNDGLTDYDEVNYDNNLAYNPYSLSNPDGTDLNANESDTDSDGFNDLVELTWGSNPLNSLSTPTAMADGDLNNDGLVNAADVLIATRIATGQISMTPDQMIHGDVAPLVNGLPSPNEQFNAGDVLIIQRKAIGVISF